MERKIKIWLDDDRPAPDESWLVARNYREAVALMGRIDAASFSAVEELSLDHDLGWCDVCQKEHPGKGEREAGCTCACHMDGLDVLKWMAANGMWPTNRPTVHSANTVGAKDMRMYIDLVHDHKETVMNHEKLCTCGRLKPRYAKMCWVCWHDHGHPPGECDCPPKLEGGAERP